jgi:glycosyltransferase involved in cell wall biosynthesis
VNGTPLITIVLPVLNGERHLGTAIASVCAQTFRSWELLVIDDGSTDRSAAIAERFAHEDPRVRLISLGRNTGMAAATNRGIRESRGRYIARMDDDDICHSDRLALQFAFLEKNAGCVAVGSQVRLIGPEGDLLGDKSFPLADQEIRQLMFRFTPLQHSSVLFRGDSLREELYDESIRYAEDLELYFRLGRRGSFANLPEFLLQYRQSPDSVTFCNAKASFFETCRIRESNAALLPADWKRSLGLLAARLAAYALPSGLIFPLYTVARRFSRARGARS